MIENGVSYAIRLSALQVNSAKANNFALQAAMIYGAVILMVICLTILSLQQLLDVGKFKYRLSVLWKLGVEEQQIGKLVLKQLGVWFELPIFVAILVSKILNAYFIQTVSVEISAYIGFGALMLQIGMIVGGLTLLLVCYFISRWILFKKSINNRISLCRTMAKEKSRRFFLCKTGTFENLAPYRRAWRQ